MQLEPPYTMVISGQTGSGKTHFTQNLIKNQEALHTKPFDKITLAYSIMQPVYMALQSQVPNLNLVEGFPDDLLEDNQEHQAQLLVLDDLMLDLENDKRLPMLFTKLRHLNISTIFIVQNLYFNSKYMTTITRNAHYLTVFPNPRDAGMVMTLGRQIFPLRPKFLPDAFNQATSKPFGYLFIDLKPQTHQKFRVREGILPDEQDYVYLPK